MLRKKLKAPLPTNQRVAPSRDARKPVRRARDEEELEGEVEEVEEEEEEEEEVETRPTNKVVDRRELRRRERASAPPATEEEDEEEVEEEEEEEKPRDRNSRTIVRKGAKPLPNKTKGKRSALADAFNRAPMAGRGIKAGQHEAILTKLEDFASGDGRIFLRSHYTLCEELEGKNTVVGITMIADADGEPVWSIALIEEMCAKLGYELERPMSAEDFDQIYDDIEQVRPGCIIDVSYSDKGQQRVSFVDGCENETIEQYRDSLPF